MGPDAPPSLESSQWLHRWRRSSGQKHDLRVNFSQCPFSSSGSRSVPYSVFQQGWRGCPCSWLSGREEWTLPTLAVHPQVRVSLLVKPSHGSLVFLFLTQLSLNWISVLYNIEAVFLKQQDFEVHIKFCSRSNLYHYTTMSYTTLSHMPVGENMRWRPLAKLSCLEMWVFKK